MLGRWKWLHVDADRRRRRGEDTGADEALPVSRSSVSQVVPSLRPKSFVDSVSRPLVPLELWGDCCQRDSQLARGQGYTGTHVVACRSRARSSKGKWHGVELRNTRPKHGLRRRLVQSSHPHPRVQEVAHFGASTRNNLSGSTVCWRNAKSSSCTRLTLYSRVVARNRAEHEFGAWSVRWNRPSFSVGLFR